MDKFDCVVIGAGNAGLVAALTLQERGKKVLLLEKELGPGGLSSSFVRGRFEFDTNVFPFNGMGTFDNPGNIYELFERLGIRNKVEFEEKKECFHLIDQETNMEYTLPFGVENFIEKMEEYVPNSKDAMTTFFGLCDDIKEAFYYRKEQKGTLDEKDLYQKYPNFVQLAPYKVDVVLEKIKMPKKAIEILSSFWIYLGSPISHLSFVSFALLVDSYVRYGIDIPKFTSFEVSRVLEQEFLNHGGKVRYLSKVKEILVEDHQVVGVKTEEDVFETSHVICNISPRMVYGSNIEKESVPIQCFQLENERILGPKEITVYLGLNETVEELGLTHSTYLISNHLDSKEEYKKMHEVFNRFVLANVIPKKDTTILVLSGFIFGDGFEKMLKKGNYFEIKEELAESLISTFESFSHLSIRDTIEEIEIATPVTFARYTGHPNGSIYGYLAKGYDNLLPKIFSEEEELRISGLRFCGCYGASLSDSASTYLNGEEVALKTLGECE